MSLSRSVDDNSSSVTRGPVPDDALKKDFPTTKISFETVKPLPAVPQARRAVLSRSISDHGQINQVKVNDRPGNAKGDSRQQLTRSNSNNAADSDVLSRERRDDKEAEGAGSSSPTLTLKRSHSFKKSGGTLERLPSSGEIGSSSNSARRVDSRSGESQGRIGEARKQSGADPEAAKKVRAMAAKASDSRNVSPSPVGFREYLESAERSDTKPEEPRDAVCDVGELRLHTSQRDFSTRKTRDPRRTEVIATTEQFIIPNTPLIRIEKPAFCDSIHLTAIEDIYRTKFYSERHLNFILLESEQDVEYLNGKHYILSVLEKAEVVDGNELHAALKTTPKGTEALDLKLVPGARDNLVDRISLSLRDTMTAPDSWYYVPQRELQESIVQIEQKYRQCQEHMKIAVLYVKKGQVTPEEWFSNKGDDISPQFWEFINTLSTRIEDMSEHQGYKGDIPKGAAYYLNWYPPNSERRIECVFHVGPTMNEEEHRRLIGNDIGVIFFLEENALFDPSNIAELGAVPQIYVLVQAQKNTWRVAFFCNYNIIEFDPCPPLTGIDNSDTLISLILTKLYNGLVATMYSKPLDRLFYTPRSVFIESLCKSYPRAAVKGTMRVKEKDAPKKEDGLLAYTLNFRLIGARELANDALMRCYAVITVKAASGTTKKTKALASQFPLWNSSFSFSIVGLTPLSLFYEDIEIEVFKKNNGVDELIGYCLLPLTATQKATGQHWLDLQDKKYAVMNDYEIQQKGQVMVAYDLVPN